MVAPKVDRARHHNLAALQTLWLRLACLQGPKQAHQMGPAPQGEPLSRHKSAPSLIGWNHNLSRVVRLCAMLTGAYKPLVKQQCHGCNGIRARIAFLLQCLGCQVPYRSCLDSKSPLLVNRLDRSYRVRL